MERDAARRPAGRTRRGDEGNPRCGEGEGRETCARALAGGSQRPRVGRGPKLPATERARRVRTPTGQARRIQLALPRILGQLTSSSSTARTRVLTELKFSPTDRARPGSHFLRLFETHEEPYDGPKFSREFQHRWETRRSDIRETRWTRLSVFQVRAHGSTDRDTGTNRCLSWGQGKYRTV